MKRALSRNSIESYCGNVLPLRLLGGVEYGQEPITWRCVGDCVQMNTFAGEEKGKFTDGVLLTLLKPGKATVTAMLDGEEYVCSVSVHAIKEASSEDPMNYYIGDFHDHATATHNPEEFQNRGAGILPVDYIRQVRDEGLLDFGVVSDHACLLNDKEYYLGYSGAEEAEPMDLIVFPGAEAEVTAIEEDRFGVPHKNSGEIVVVNAKGYASTRSWEEFFARYADSPFAIAVLAHPQIVGISVKGIWNFCLEKNNSPRFQQMIRGVEMGDGTDRSSNLINEYVYANALDHGFRVAPTCSSDSHGPEWGYHRFPGKTIIMAPEKSKEAFMDALMHNRFYASSSGNIKLKYTVNGKTAPVTLLEATKYDFHVELSYFYEDETTVPVKCQVISNGGVAVKELALDNDSSFDFTVESETATYFYLCLIDSEGRKTWSCPVWTGRAPASEPTEPLVPLSKDGCTAVDVKSGKDASVVINNNPYDPWFAEGATCSVLIDLQEPKKIAALGHYPRIFDKIFKRLGIDTRDMIAQFPSRYEIHTSMDGVTFEKQAEGRFLVFGGEEIIRFPEHSARYVRLDVLSTTGLESARKIYADAKVAISELTVFQKA